MSKMIPMKEVDSDSKSPAVGDCFPDVAPPSVPNVAKGTNSGPQLDDNVNPSVESPSPKEKDGKAKHQEVAIVCRANAVMRRNCFLVILFVLLSISTWRLFEAKRRLRIVGASQNTQQVAQPPVSPTIALDSAEQLRAERERYLQELQLRAEIERYEQELRQFKESVKSREKAHLHRLSVRRDRFIRGLHNSGPNRFLNAYAAIPIIKESVSSFAAMSGIVKDAALDQIRGGTRLDDRITASIDGPFIQPCLRAREQLIEDCEAYAQELDVETKRFLNEIEISFNDLETNIHDLLEKELPLDRFESDLRPIVVTMRGRGVDTEINLGAVALEAKDIASTFLSLKRIVLNPGATAKLLFSPKRFIKSAITSIRSLVIKSAGKTAAKAGASVVASQADSPLPGPGDVVAVAGLIWTAWDIHQLLQVVPGEIEKGLISTVEELQRDTLTTLEQEAVRIHDGYAKVVQNATAVVLGEEIENTVNNVEFSIPLNEGNTGIVPAVESSRE